MKNLNKFIGCCVIAMPLLTACTGDYDSMNTNPAAVTDVSPAYTLPTVIELATNVDCFAYQVGENLYAQFYAQYFTNTQTGWATDRYGYNDGWAVAGFWNPYFSALKHLKVLKKEVATHPSYSNIYQMMRIIMAERTAAMTDIYGDMPYSEAALGNDGPAYDAQKDIYYDVFKELTEASDALGQNLSNQETCTQEQDLIYAGDIQKWRKFANSLRLRYALRLVNVDPAKAKAEGEAALAAGVMNNEDESAMEKVFATAGWGHPLYMICAWNGFVMSKTMENIFKHESTVFDPRMPMWFGKTQGYHNAEAAGTLASFPGSEFQGVANGVTDQMLLAKDASGYAQYGFENNSFPWGLQAFPEWNGENKSLKTTVLTLPLKVMGYSEVCFLKAEAAVRGWAGAGSAQANYEAGIRASFAEARAGVDASLYSTANDNTYITTGNVAWNSAASNDVKLKKIITQKWIALYPDGIEAWAEFRRTGYPDLMPVQKSDNPDINPAAGEFVKKLRYPDAERRDNPNATKNTLNGGKGDGMNIRVWWDTNSH